MDSREESRDILIELRSDVRHIRQTMEELRLEQREEKGRVDSISATVQEHKGSISFLTRGFWTVIAAVGTCGSGIVLWLVNRK